MKFGMPIENSIPIMIKRSKLKPEVAIFQPRI